MTTRWHHQVALCTHQELLYTHQETVPTHHVILETQQQHSSLAASTLAASSLAAVPIRLAAWPPLVAGVAVAVGAAPPGWVVGGGLLCPVAACCVGVCLQVITHDLEVALTHKLWETLCGTCWWV